MEGHVQINSKPYYLRSDDNGKGYYRDYHEGKAGNSKIPINLSMTEVGGGYGYGDSGYGYGDSFGFDCRNKGKIKLFPKENSFALASKGVVVANGADNPNSNESAGPNYASDWGFENWSDSTTLSGSFWTLSSNLTIEREDTITHGGSYGLKFTGGDSDTETLTFSVNLRTFTNTSADSYALQNRRVTLALWVYCNAANSVRLKLQPFTEAGMVVGEGNKTAGAWEQIKVVAYTMWPYNTTLTGVIEWNRQANWTTGAPTTTPPTTILASTTIAATTAAPTTTWGPGDDIIDDCSLVFESDSSGTPEGFFLDGNNAYLYQGANIYKYTADAPFNFLTKVPSMSSPIEVSDDSDDNIDLTDEAKGKLDNSVPICRGKMSIFSDVPFYGIAFKLRLDYDEGGASFVDGSRTVEGTSTKWEQDMVGCWIKTTGSRWYRIESVETATSLTIEASTGNALTDGATVTEDGSYTITPIKDNTGYRNLSIQYYNGSTYVDVPWLSDQTDSFGSYLHQANTVYDDRYYIICWDTDSMAAWEKTSTDYTKVHDSSSTAFEITVNCSNTLSDYWTYSNQVLLLHSEEDEGVITDYGSSSIGSYVYNMVPYDSKIWAFCGNDYAYCSIDSTNKCLPTYSSSDNYGKFCVSHKGKFFTNLTDDAISVATDLNTGNFETPTEIKTGTENLSITSLAIHQDRIIVGKENELYGVVVWADGSRDYVASLELGNLGYDSEELTQFGGMPSEDNFRNMASIDGALYLPHTKGMWVIEGQSIINVSPYLKMPEYTNLHGSVQAVCPGRDWNYFVIENDSGSGDSRVCAIRKQYVRGEGEDYRIHPLAKCNIDDVGGAMIYNDTLWICGDDTNDDPYLSYYIFDDSTQYPDLNASGLTIYYKVDNGSWTEVGGAGQGTITAAGETSFGSSPPAGYKIKVALCDEDSDADPDTATYVWESGWSDANLPNDKKVFSSVVVTGQGFTSDGSSSDIEITGVLINCYIDNSDNAQRMWSMKIDCSERVENGRSADSVRADLRTAASSSTTTFVDVHGESHTVMFDPPTPEEQYVDILTETPGRFVGNTMDVVLREVT